MKVTRSFAMEQKNEILQASSGNGVRIIIIVTRIKDNKKSN